MCHAACKVEFQPFNRRYSQLPPIVVFKSNSNRFPPVFPMAAVRACLKLKCVLNSLKRKLCKIAVPLPSPIKRRVSTWKKTNNMNFLGWFLCESDSELQIVVRSQKQISFVQIDTGFLCENGCGDGIIDYVVYTCTGVICLFARVIQQCLHMK